ncbi:MAG TPA: hypothetical protein VF412_01380 [Bdellovibrio sp.]|uniref:hypothetical protein n=1 Tax=Bdellovibrio sp. TaxID=28201 RepID=UPI002EDEC434
MINPLNLFKPYFDLTLGSKKTHITRVLERPGLWMTPQQLDNLIKDLRSVVTSLNIGDLDYGIVKGSKQALDNAVITLIYDGPSGRPFAFNALTIMNCTVRGHSQQVVHLGLVVVDPNNRAKGLSWILYGLTTFLLFIKNRFKPVWISNVTQVPAIIGMVSESFGNVYPNPQAQTRRTYDHLVLAREIMTRYRYVFGVGPDAEFDEEAFVIQNAYTGGSDNLKKTFAQAPKHRSAIYNDFAGKVLDYDRGDDILQLGQMDVSSYYRYMIHSIPKGSFLVLIYKVFFSFMEFSLVPVIQWFSTSKQMGSLRPRK